MTTISAIAIFQMVAFIGLLLIALRQHLSGIDGFKVFRTLTLGMLFEVMTSIFTTAAAHGTPDHWMPAFGLVFGAVLFGFALLHEVESVKTVSAEA